ncbi:tryptophan halogenase family protein [Sphingomonas sp. G-3-2-10]|uniref:tryptophan halogenase family protein n=1 Tax=Sphingomonas sp. G-3-2-10 TaxID=2728838 RepID=UPI00146DAB75|nr:tryptophan halogenase family protein [Sphingomonas sp. G-3-2-10]NML05722.1 tryptophan 7-halogenase [Sphingomonas sp. G-3-2-10]
MAKPIRNITIVGGGTTGWLAAAVLNHRLQWGFAHPEGVSITLIESPEVPIIGVGEATLPGLLTTLQSLEISEAEFVTRTNATFKLGVKFDDWHSPKGGKPSSYFHPFTGGVQVAGRNPALSLLRYGLPEDLDIDPQLGNIIGHGVAAASSFKSPKRPTDAPYQGPLGYAYHVDATLFAAFLQEIAVARGVSHVTDTVRSVERNERGHIAALQLAEGGRHEVELVIDCSGFRGLLINQALEEPFISFSDYLLNDRAVVVQVKHGEGERLAPVTNSTALGSGWRFRIPLQSRYGTGYIHSSAFIDRAAATDELMASLGDAEKMVEPREIRMRVGRTRRSWVGNCVALGLASGFVEPLESTAIQFVDHACRRLLQCLPSSDFEPAPIEKFNTQMADLYDDVRDFLGLHFTLGDRDDTPYWRAMRNEVKRSDKLEECLALWKDALPDSYDPRRSDIFTFWSVACVLFGKNYYDTPPLSGSDLLPQSVWENYLRNFVNMRKGLLGLLAGHEEMLRLMGEQAVIGESAARRPSHNAVPVRGVALGPPVPVMMPGPISLAS